MISAFAVAAALAVALTTVGAYLRHRRRITAQRRAIVERVAVQLRESLQRFPKVSVAVRHEKRRGSYILVHQKRGENEAPLKSFAWMHFVWRPAPKVGYMTRTAPTAAVQYCSPSEQCLTFARREIVAFLARYNEPASVVLTVGE